jgi:argininosuccinate lyase
MTNVNSDKLSSARFAQATDAFVEVFTASVDFDQRMAQQDIQGSIAHAKMLCSCGILTEKERDDIISGLTQISQEIINSEFTWSIKQEDVHMNIEARLTDLIGIAGKKLHTGRSRNDQVATDIRLYLRSEIQQILGQLTRLQTAILDLAEQHADTIMPGFTHLQVAQPITFGHHLMAWFEMLIATEGCRIAKRINIMPPRAAALAGKVPHRRQMTSFARLCVHRQLLDSVADRDLPLNLRRGKCMIYRDFQGTDPVVQRPV